jgi:outer membrane protein assembly factor BamB
MADGDILLFDNRGANIKDGGSRLIEFDPETGRTDWSYAGSISQPFRSDKSGGEERLPNGNTLVSEDDAGRVFEVNRKGKIVWEYRDVRLHHASRVTKDWLKFVPTGVVP